MAPLEVEMREHQTQVALWQASVGLPQLEKAK
jgi:hypothetical protein